LAKGAGARTPRRKGPENEFYTLTPGNNKYLVNYHVVPLEKAARRRVCERLRTGPSKPISSKTIDFSFYTSEHNDGHEGSFCRNGEYSPGARPSTDGKELWRKWKFVYTGNARVPC
jgi:hypothetical protein